MKYIYKFFEGNKKDIDLLGGKGANLAEMTNMGLCVPKGFTISTKACKEYLSDNSFWNILEEEVNQNIKYLENETNKKFNDDKNPLLVSVRSGSKFSMPGMLDTILNLGLNDKTVNALIKITKNERFAYDCYRRLIQMYGDVVDKIDKNLFEKKLEEIKIKYNKKNDSDLTSDQLIEVINEYKKIYKDNVNKEFPQDPYKQIYKAIKAVFNSWDNNRAMTYRKLHNISHNLGTAVNIQQMVFGNFGKTSGSGVAFTRNPNTGEKGIFGEFLENSQGEDVVAGIRTPKCISEIKSTMPEAYNEFLKICDILEKHYKDMQDIEFTIENGKLYILQTRNGKRTANASIKIFLSLLKEGILDEENTLLKLDASSVEQLLHPLFDKNDLKNNKELTTGLPACPGAATGEICFTSREAIEKAKNGKKVILIRKETSPEDIEGMTISEAIITSTGGMTSHAAVVARGIGKCCVVGCNEIKVDYKNNRIQIKNDKTLNKGDIISVDGTTGKIYKGEIKKSDHNNSKILDELFNIMEFIIKKHNLNPIKVKSNADTPKDIQKSINLGADGIGLVRTEHMFFGSERINNFRKMFLSKNKNILKENLSKLKKFQKNDFYKIFKILNDKSCTIRLLDPPLHEFLPKNKEEFQELANLMNISVRELEIQAESLKEINPMLGHRGCRLGITIIDIYIMQSLAIIEAAVKLKKENSNMNIRPEIMIPLISIDKELSNIRNIIDNEIQKYLEKENIKIEYKIGSMLETPRACLIINDLCNYSDFFSFGTNDLTQLVYGFSRDDSHKFLDKYYNKKIIKNDPFQTLDIKGVGKLIKNTVETCKNDNSNFKGTFGVCGEIAGDPRSIDFLTSINIDYVSCSPFRVSTTKIACVQSALKQKLKIKNNL